MLRKGGVILYPTDTLYGLGIDVTVPEAVEKLYKIKGRSNKKPVSLMVGSLRQIEKISEIYPPEIKAPLKRLFPGKITVLLKNRLLRKISAFEYLSYTLEKVGFRIPENEFCNLLSAQMENPVSTTSANISGQTDIRNISELPNELTEQLDLIIDAGDAEDMRGSTIIDFTQKPYKIVRKGAVSRDEIMEILNVTVE